MPRFFVTASQIGVRDDLTKTVLITGDDASHITRSLRMKEGERIVVCDMARTEYDCEIVSVGDTVTARVVAERASSSEPPYKATLYQALVKGDKFDTIVQKAVECGVCRIVPVLTDRCIVRLNKKECEKKVARWQRIADEAAKQCGRGALVAVGDLMTYKEAIAAAAKDSLSIFCYEGEETRSLRSALESTDGVPETVSFMIGSEGGFSASEASAAEAAGLVPVSLGRRILRTETASSFVLACISYEFE